MGFYAPDTIVRDSQHHGLKVRAIDVNRSDWFCTIELSNELMPKHELRMGLRYVRGLRRGAGEAVVRERNSSGPFCSVEEVCHRVPELRKEELASLAEVGALNSTYSSKENGHRRTALWDVARAIQEPGPLFANIKAESLEAPLECMTNEERLVADYRGTGLTTGPHPLFYNRAELDRMQVVTASRVRFVADGTRVTVAGCAIVRQRPGTASGLLFMSLEDETGISNVVVMPDLFERYRLLINRERFLLIIGKMQNMDGVLTVRAERVQPLHVTAVETASHDYH